MGCDQCQNSLGQKAVHTSHIPTYSLKLGVCVLTCWKQGVCVAEMWGMCYGNGGYVSVVEKGGAGYVLWKLGVCISCKNGGYVLWILCMYQLQKWGYVLQKYVSVAEMWGMCCRNVGYVSVAELWVCVAEMGVQDLDMCQVKLCNGTCDIM